MKREELGLNDPILVRYFNYMKDLLHGDMGTSWFTSNPGDQGPGSALPPRRWR